MANYDLDTTSLGTLLENPEVAAIIEKHAPGATTNPMLAMAKSMPAAQVLSMAGSFIGQDNVDKIKADIEAL